MREVDVSEDSELFNNMLGFRFQPQKQRRMEKNGLSIQNVLNTYHPKRLAYFVYDHRIANQNKTVRIKIGSIINCHISFMMVYCFDKFNHMKLDGFKQYDLIE